MARSTEAARPVAIDPPFKRPSGLLDTARMCGCGRRSIQRCADCRSSNFVDPNVATFPFIFNRPTTTLAKKIETGTHVKLQARACSRDHAPACARWRVAVPIFLARVVVVLPYCYYYLRVLYFANFCDLEKIAKLSTCKNFYQHISGHLVWCACMYNHKLRDA